MNVIFGTELCVSGDNNVLLCELLRQFPILWEAVMINLQFSICNIHVAALVAVLQYTH